MQLSIIGIDLSKTSCSLVGLDEASRNPKTSASRDGNRQLPATIRLVVLGAIRSNVGSSLV